MMPPRRKLRLAILLGILAALAAFVALGDRYAPFPVYAYDFDNSMRENWPAVPIFSRKTVSCTIMLCTIRLSLTAAAAGPPPPRASMR
jgi:hypothetical protein